MLILFPLQQWSQERATMLRYTYIAHRVSSVDTNSQYIGNANDKHLKLISKFWKAIYVSFSCPTHKYILSDDDLLRSKHVAAVKCTHS
jgi:hypothetical protein